MAVRVDSGIPESAILAYFQSSDRIKPVFLDERLMQTDLQQYDCLQFDRPLYFVSRGDQLAGMNKFFTEIKRFSKPNGNNFIGLYSLKENCLGRPLVLKSPL